MQLIVYYPGRDPMKRWCGRLMAVELVLQYLDSVGIFSGVGGGKLQCDRQSKALSERLMERVRLQRSSTTLLITPSSDACPYIWSMADGVRGGL
eukprot:CAMPEP_0173115064 /NCGR_PEP_ID=MMETSP1102-20130122/48131_1 /TAXON_ID=49646 /ORGANISM="Geminigera sp., Strain Caron Lab Isolate" /LENGTH=93 /DNA_ID=CAMNT_0014017735 /DNA_START=150 /DNA_END=432 /DNA_ORIENTATION=+